MVLKMSKDKMLCITKRNNTYEDEHNAESIKIFAPKEFNGRDLTLYSVFLNIKNKNLLGDIIDIGMLLEDVGEDMYGCEIKMSKKFTYESGEIEIWIEILGGNEEVVAKTNPVTHSIKPHPNIEDYIPEQDITVMQQWQSEVSDAVKEACIARDESISASKDAIQIVEEVKEVNSNPPIIGDNKNWYIWKDGGYIDTGYTSMGTKGEPGTNGYTPVKGMDYLTEQDIAELKIPVVVDVVEDLNNGVPTSGAVNTAIITEEYQRISNDTSLQEQIIESNNKLDDLKLSIQEKENSTNKVQVIDSSANDTQYPSVQAVKAYVDNEIATFDFIKILDTLPEEGLPNRMYLVPKSDQQNQDLFDEYVWINGSWEWITTKRIEVDLTNYIVKDAFVYDTATETLTITI